MFEVVFARELGKRNFFRGKIDFEDITLVESVLEVALPASVMLKRGADVPPDLPVFAEGSTSIRGRVGNNLSTHRGEWRSVKSNWPRREA